jgi:hypothetical protein
MDEQTPVFDATTASWSQAVLFQALITELIEGEVLPVDRAKRVFEVAIKRANSARDHLPDAERLIAHIRDDLRWDGFHALAAQRKQNKDPSGDRK